MSEAATQDAVTVERFLPHAPEKVWRALTEADLLVLWLLPNDFRPVVGHRFTLHCQPPLDPDCRIGGEVVESRPPRRLVYRWVGSADAGSPGRPRLDTIVTWTLEPARGGTLVRLVHDGFAPSNRAVYEVMRPGWERKIGELADALAIIA